MVQQALAKKVHAAITRLYHEGDELAERGRDQAAHDKYQEAWDLIPADKENWEEATWILGAVGELHFRGGKFAQAVGSYLRAVDCPNGSDNPYIRLRLGQAQFELGEPDAAADNLARAYTAGGEDAFADEDPKYLEFLQTRLDPPPGGW
jgi:tetratricopeptide (TPR) repeat protein